MSILSPTDSLQVTCDKLRPLGNGTVTLNTNFAPGVGLIEFNHPERHNSFSGKMMAEFRDIILKLDQISDDSDMVALIVTGCRGKSFCAGIDLAFTHKYLQGSTQASETVNRFMHDTLTRFANLPLITVASLAGATLGGGTEILTAFDYSCMDSSTFIRFVQTRMGVTSPWGGARRLVSRIGQKNALRILAGAPVLDAHMAYSMGLVDKVVEKSSTAAAYDTCLRTCLDWVDSFVVDQKSGERVASAPVRGMKRLMVRSIGGMATDVDYEMYLFNSVVGSSKL